MNPTTNQVSMQEYASENDRYKSMPNEEQTRAGVVPLDSLPAAWWNALWEIVTKNNNAILFSIADLRTEIGNVLTAAGITADAHTTNQLATAIFTIHKKTPYFENNNPVPGSVISSSDRNSISVGNDGKMVVNALSDWTSSDSVKTVLDALGTEIESTNIASVSATYQNDVLTITLTATDGTSYSGTVTIDTSSKQNKTLDTAITVDGTSQTTVESALGAINTLAGNNKTNKQNKTLDTAITVDGTSQTTVESALGAINTLAAGNKTALANKADIEAMSTSEYVTNRKWTDGKRIYGRVLTVEIVIKQNSSFPTNYTVYALCVFNNTLYVGTNNHGIYTSTDGITFTQNTSFPTTYIAQAFCVFNNTLFAGAYNHGIYTSTDGITFTQNTSFPTNYNVRASGVFNNTLYTGFDTPTGIYTFPEISSSITLSNISELLFTQLRNASGPLGLKSAYIDSSNHLVAESDGTPTQAIIEYTKTA